MLSDILSGNFIWLIALIIAITVHEFAHAFAAESLGDPTPRLMGRLTLNPLAHLDPIGTLFMLFTRFGWGKPVQFDPFNLKEPRKDAALISLAGPASNILTASVFALVFRLVLFSGGQFTVYGFNTNIILNLLLPIIFINVGLAVFNLLPIHPLDGFKVVEGILPDNYVNEWRSLQNYGYIFLFILIAPFSGGGFLQAIIMPPISFILRILVGTSFFSL